MRQHPPLNANKILLCLSDDTDINESFIQLFDGDAYETGWLLNYQLQLVEVFHNTGGSCGFPGDNWQIVNTYYTGNSRWAHN